MRQDEASEVRRRTAAYPTVEDLQRVSACIYLLGRVLHQHARDAPHKLIPSFRIAIHEAFGLDISTRSSAFNHVARQGEWSAAEANHRKTCAEVSSYQAHGLRHVTQFGGSIGLELGDAVGIAQGRMNLGSIALSKLKVQAHHCQRQ